MAQRADRVVAVLGALPFLLGLGWLSGTSLVATIGTLPYDSTATELEAARPVAPQEARAAAHANVAAAGWFDGGRYRLRAARLLLALPAKERGAVRHDVERLVRASVAEAPMSPFGWLLLTFLRMDAQDAAGAERAWDMSILTGRYVPDLMRSRILLGIELLTFSPGIRDSVIDQVRVLATADPQSLAQTASAGGIEPFVRAVLIDPAQAAAFERETAAYRAQAVYRLREAAAAGQRP